MNRLTQKLTATQLLKVYCLSPFPESIESQLATASDEEVSYRSLISAVDQLMNDLQDGDQELCRLKSKLSRCNREMHAELRNTGELRRNLVKLRKKATPVLRRKR